MNMVIGDMMWWIIVKFMNDSKQNAKDSITGALLNITPAATQELKRIATEEVKFPRVRIGFRAGGCSGYSIDMDFTKFPADEEYDQVFDCDGVTFIIDNKSALFMKDATLDFGGKLLDQGFQWSFPDSTSGCGCGISFSF